MNRERNTLTKILVNKTQPYIEKDNTHEQDWFNPKHAMLVYHPKKANSCNSPDQHTLKMKKII